MQREATIHENSPAAAFSMNLKQHLPMLLEGLFAQIKSVSGLFLTRRLPEDYSFDSDSGIDADADMYRNSLKRVVVSLIRLYPAAYLDFINLLFRSVVPLEPISPWLSGATRRPPSLSCTTLAMAATLPWATIRTKVCAGARREE